jgi:hypothetical protein
MALRVRQEERVKMCGKCIGRFRLIVRMLLRGWTAVCPNLRNGEGEVEAVESVTLSGG